MIGSRIGSLVPCVVPSDIHLITAIGAIHKSRQGIDISRLVLLPLADRGFHLTALVPKLLRYDGFVSIVDRNHILGLVLDLLSVLVGKRISLELYQVSKIDGIR